jgi:hypothetical protein
MGALFSTPKVPKLRLKKKAKSRGRKSKYEDEFTEERVMSGFVPGVYMTDNYAPPPPGFPGSFTPGSAPMVAATPAPVVAPATGLPASVTKTGAPTKPPTAGKSKFADWPGTIDSGASIEPEAGMSRMRKISHFVNNQPSQPGVNLADATPLSPMAERMERVAYPINFSMALLVILFIVFVMMRK